MDFGTLIGFILACVLIAFGMGSYVSAFTDIPSLLIVVGGTTGTVLMSFPISTLKGIGGILKKAIFASPPQFQSVFATIMEFASRARREGLLSLEGVENDTDDVFFIKGINMAVDGLEVSIIEETLQNQLSSTEDRHKTGYTVFMTIAALAPAMGMIGTLIGLVIMLQNLSDPDAIGPSMAIALMTTFYGAFIANVIALPIANKLQQRSEEEILAMRLVMEGILSIAVGDNPRIVENKLNSFLAPKEHSSS